MRCRVSDGTTALFEGLVVVGGCGVASQEDKSSCPGDHGAFPPRHQTATLQLFMGHELHFFLPMIAGMESRYACGVTRDLSRDSGAPSAAMGLRSPHWMSANAIIPVGAAEYATTVITIS